jgi:hypothetical protein
MASRCAYYPKITKKQAETARLKKEAHEHIEGLALISYKMSTDGIMKEADKLEALVRRARSWSNS